MSVEIIIPLAAIIIVLVILFWLFKVVKASIKTMLVIVSILIILQLAFGIDSQEFIQEVWQIVTRAFES